MNISPSTSSNQPIADIDFTKCIICENEFELVTKPEENSYEQILDFMKERAGYGDDTYANDKYARLDASTALHFTAQEMLF